MARIFDITAGTEGVHLDSSGHGEMPFTVTNVGGRQVRVRVQPVPQEPVKASWLALSGNERDILPGATQQFTVAVKVSPGASSGTFSFGLDALDVANPDDNYTQGPAVSIEIALPPPVPKPFPWWIPVVVAAVLIGGGLAIWKLAGTNPGPVVQPTPPTISTAPPHATPPRLSLPGTPVRVANGIDETCLSPKEGDALLNIHNPVVHGGCDGETLRFWTINIVIPANNTVELANNLSKKCLTLFQPQINKEKIGAKIDQDECMSQDPARAWIFKPIDSTSFQLRNQFSELCLAVPLIDNSDTLTVIQSKCDANSARWYFVP